MNTPNENDDVIENEENTNEENTNENGQGTEAEQEVLESGDESTSAKRDIVPPEYRQLYKENGGNNGDFIAAELSSVMKSGGILSLNAIKAENGLAESKWSGLNNGQQRMNLSNTLRAAFLRGDTITVIGKQHDINVYKEEFGDLDVENESEANRFLDFVSIPQTERNRKALIRVFKTIPEQVVNRAKREEEREQAKIDKAKKAEEKKAADAEKKAKAEAEKAAKAEAGEEPAENPKRSRKKKADAEATQEDADAGADA